MNIIKKTTAFIFALLFVAGAPAVVPVGFSASNSAITAEAASPTDNSDIALTLCGNVDAESIRSNPDKLRVISIVAEEGTVLPADCSWLFKGYRSAETIDLSKADTSNVTNMEHMFDLCVSLSSLDISGFDTSNVTNMSSMFDNCYNLKKLDLSNFDTSKVFMMGDMFRRCENLTSLNVSSFNTANVMHMANMFDSCSKLESLDIRNFNTSNVTSMYSMFYNCSNLSELDVSSFDTSKVTDMAHMFRRCSSLKTLDVSNFNTSNVTNTQAMFGGCTQLSTIDLNSFDTAKVTNMNSMFESCKNLKTINADNFDISNVRDFIKMFYYCENLKTIYVSKPWNIASDIPTGNMFYGCEKIVGGNHTTYDEWHTGGDYARIDNSKNKGYLTERNYITTTNSMTLGGSISLNFYFDLSCVPSNMLPMTYVDFEVNGKKQRAEFNPNKMNSSKTAYGFNCKLNSISMADNVKAKLVYYTDDQVAHEVTKVATCETYLNKFNENDKPATWNLIKSINDYGYYMQRYLCNHAKTKWVLGVDHKAMEKAYTSEADFAAKKSTYLNELSAYKKQISINKDIEKANFSLVLESDTTLNLKIKPASGYTGSISYKLDGKPVTATKIDNGRYQVSVPGISAHLLNEAHTLEIITDSGTSTFTVSALSYAYECVKAPLDTTEYNAMCALYDYYKATVAYKK